MERLSYACPGTWRDRARDWLAIRVGRWQYRLGHHRRDRWGGPFNGQAFRQRLFVEMVQRIPFTAIVETGTHRGTTTAFFRRATMVPVYSFELNPRYYAFARAKLRALPDLHLRWCDSRVGLAALARSNAVPPGERVFVYLDAHGAGELPLADEIALVFQHWLRAIVMIDDFAVPDDPGYSFDDFGAHDALTLSYLIDHTVLPAGVWFPRCGADSESGARRGCAILANDADVIRQVDALMTVRRWTNAEKI
jgi:hypothetical protein